VGFAYSRSALGARVRSPLGVFTRQLEDPPIIAAQASVMCAVHKWSPNVTARGFVNLIGDRRTDGPAAFTFTFDGGASETIGVTTAILQADGDTVAFLCPNQSYFNPGESTRFNLDENTPNFVTATRIDFRSALGAEFADLQTWCTNPNSNTLAFSQPLQPAAMGQHFSGSTWVDYFQNQYQGAGQIMQAWSQTRIIYTDGSSEIAQKSSASNSAARTIVTNCVTVETPIGWSRYVTPAVGLTTKTVRRTELLDAGAAVLTANDWVFQCDAGGSGFIYVPAP